MIPAEQWMKEAEKLAPELKALRREFHRHPELGNQEFRTAARVEAWLHSCGIETVRLTDTAVMGILHGAKPGPTVALRADMDALPINEATGCPFASEVPGVMHACGHDVHTASALGAARLLSLHREELAGNVRFFFQPDEEDRGGAERMIAAGCMDDVRAVFGAHISPTLPLGKVGIRYGRFYAASAMFNVTVCGKSAHGAEPEKGRDALAAAAEMVSAIREMNNFDPKNRLVVTIGSFHAGTARNIIAEKAEFRGMIRTLGPELRQQICDRLTQIVESTARAYDLTAETEIIMSYVGVTNTDKETTIVESAAKAALGEENVVIIEEPTMTTEDMGYFIARAAGSFYHIGAGCSLPLHNAGFLPDERAVPLAAGVHAATLAACLDQLKNEE